MSCKSKAVRNQEQEYLQEMERAEFRSNLARKQLDFIKEVLDLNDLFKKDEYNISMIYDKNQNSYDVQVSSQNKDYSVSYYTELSDYADIIRELRYESEMFVRKIEENQRKESLLKSAKEKLSKEEYEILIESLSNEKKG